MVLSKDELEARLHAEKKQISDGRLKDDNPLDLSPPFQTLCQACRRGDLKVCQEMITEGVNINARDRFDYTPLILVSGPSDSVATQPTAGYAPVLMLRLIRPAFVASMKWSSFFWSPGPCANATLFKANGKSPLLCLSSIPLADISATST